MSDNLKKRCFTDLTSARKIRIPKIQRDYAQGRQNAKVNGIRKTFVHSLLLVVKGKIPATELDFVYGSTRKGAYEPLDGQQRLTTLFLLHWMFGEDLSDPDNRRKSLFTYETRNTSCEFCDELVQHQSAVFMSEAQERNSIPSIIIQKRDWFKWEWQYDPTICSMLVMIDSIYEETGKEFDWTANLSEFRANLKSITFNNLNLGEFGLSDELFIKMNARGKQLSDFDSLKSTLEEELQIQQSETDTEGKSLASASIEKTWRSMMDGVWIDFFWHKYARTLIQEDSASNDDDAKKRRLEAAILTEAQFKKLLLRLIAMQMLENDHTCETVVEAAYRQDEDTLDCLMTTYSDSLLYIRSDTQNKIVPNNLVTLNFNQLTEDINSLIYQDTAELFHEISDLLPESTHIAKNGDTLLDSFLGSKVANDVELVFYGMQLFLRKFPAQKNGWLLDRQEHQPWIENFGDWIRSLRNILLNDNNNSRIDKRYIFINALRGVSKLANNLSEFVHDADLDMELDGSAILKFFHSIKGKTYAGLDNQSVNEEIEKAELRLADDRWDEEILQFETDNYLWGQIRCLLNWSEGDVDLFDDYGTRLTELLNFISKDEHNLYYAALLAFEPNCWKESNRLFQHNKDRDYSFKRCLRDNGQKYYSECMRRFIDHWRKSRPNSSVEEFIIGLINNKKVSATVWDWIQCIIEYPDMLCDAGNKCLFENNGHVILAQRKTEDSHCYDPVFLYFEKLCATHNVQNYELYDSKAKHPHGFEFQKDGQTFLILWGSDGGDYAVSVDDGETKTYSVDEIVKFVRMKLGVCIDQCVMPEPSDHT